MRVLKVSHVRACIFHVSALRDRVVRVPMGVAGVQVCTCVCACAREHMCMHLQ